MEINPDIENIFLMNINKFKVTKLKKKSQYIIMNQNLFKLKGKIISIKF